MHPLRAFVDTIRTLPETLTPLLSGRTKPDTTSGQTGDTEPQLDAFAQLYEDAAAPEDGPTVEWIQPDLEPETTEGPRPDRETDAVPSDPAVQPDEDTGHTRFVAFPFEVHPAAEPPRKPDFWEPTREPRDTTAEAKPPFETVQSETRRGTAMVLGQMPTAQPVLPVAERQTETATAPILQSGARQSKEIQTPDAKPSLNEASDQRPELPARQDTTVSHQPRGLPYQNTSHAIAALPLSHRVQPGEIPQKLWSELRIKPTDTVSREPTLAAPPAPLTADPLRQVAPQISTASTPDLRPDPAQASQTAVPVDVDIHQPKQPEIRTAPMPIPLVQTPRAQDTKPTMAGKDAPQRALLNRTLVDTPDHGRASALTSPRQPSSQPVDLYLQSQSIFRPQDSKPILMFEDAVTSFPLDSADVGWDQSRPLSQVQARILTAPDMPNQIGRQMAETIAQSGGKPIELTLSPAELGRVKMSISAEDTGMVMHIAAERPETLDLMRRHIQQLDLEFRAMGYEDIAFSFGDDGQANDDGADRASDENHSTNEMDLTSAENVIAHRALAHTRGLDIRI